MPLASTDEEEIELHQFHVDFCVQCDSHRIDPIKGSSITIAGANSLVTSYPCTDSVAVMEYFAVYRRRCRAAEARSRGEVMSHFRCDDVVDAP